MSAEHRRVRVLEEPKRPRFVVWELTLRCDQACRHCGSHAGGARDHELDRAEALAVVPELAALGAREVVLIGGEAYLHEAFLPVVEALREAGIVPTMVTGGLGLTPGLARDMASAGMQLVSVSVDGLEATHDRLRARGSHRGALAAVDHVRDAGVAVGANTSVNRANRGELEPLFEELARHGVCAWQIQLTAPMGRAALRPDLILQPWDLLELLPRVAALKARARARGMNLMPGNNLGYFGPEEAGLRSLEPGGRDHFCGCQAGSFVLGIESNGGLKGCLSLQDRAFVAGSLRDEPIAALWRRSPVLGFTRARSVSALWGYCADCPYASVCLGGCSFTAHALLGRVGNNPYCHFRALEHARRGQRERLVRRVAPPTERATRDAEGHARFELVVEPFDAPDPALALTLDELVSGRGGADVADGPYACR